MGAKQPVLPTEELWQLHFRNQALVGRRQMSLSGGLPKFRLELLNGRIAPISVVPGRLSVARMQTFAEVWRLLLRCLLRGGAGGSHKSACSRRGQPAPSES
jgi:hypothetical protein